MNKKKSEVILPSIKKKTSKSRKKTAKTNMNLYSSLSYRHHAKKEATARRRAEDLAKLPKDPVKRFFARLHPKRVFKWWFSWRGQKAILKFIAACILIFIIFIGGLFLYYKKDLDEIRLDDLSISETVNTYLDRNGEILWKDTGNEDYRLVVDGEQISPYLYQATVAIEDRNFYEHKGQMINTGKTRNFKTVHIPCKNDLTGKFVNVKIAEAKTWYIKGELVNII